MLVFAPLPGPISAVFAQGYLGVTLFFVLSGFVLTWSARPEVPPAFGNELFTVACALAIVAIAQRSLDGKRSMFESRLQVKLGEWSFAFHLVHASFIYLALRIFGLQEPSWWNLLWFAVLLVVDLAAAWALHRFVERPLEKRMRRWKDRRDAARRTRPAATFTRSRGSSRRGAPAR